MRVPTQQTQPAIFTDMLLKTEHLAALIPCKALVQFSKINNIDLKT